ncbi:MULTISPECIES: DMT family transporter [unclassified Herbaspirillum]|uniref:DMT family transporter n=1 Tax=unclassified Herbaspirillum TaxID=2624150 RepID=UPI001154BB07|nr:MULTISPECIES: DMT family transporter [unclassified Herbaspirillum]MBB5391609.1 S-adenosylmethionine uptake transporter [Herbaspirillum sp. SJZ102]TQK12709.1 S-adenosylmethionine uptake transporter [Herbaspirillum sp. SJZ130]TQK14713.1 S-adenosylmethionine uptake transporter [Herbaspirillum sp. SJZ106]TWC62799.1 S-adenosylmethionine uptake transporter [Herbaspirillum sp. SJZ099]
MQSLWMLVASFLFSIMGVCVKLAGDYYTTAEIVLCRGLVGVAVICGIVFVRGGTFRTPFPRDHLIRGGVGVVSLWMWFYSFSLLPIATATTLNYMSSIWIAAMLFAANWWKGAKKFEWGLAGTVLMSFIGVALLMRPSLDANQLLGGMVALVSGVLSALVYLQVRKLGLLGEPEYRVVFYFSLTGLVAGLAGSLFTGKIPLLHTHSATGALLVLAIGLTATLAQIAMTRAYRLGNTLLTANLQYTGIVFSSLFGVVIWNDAPGWVGWSGMAIILASGIFATYRNQRSSQTTAKNVPKVDPIATEV